MSTRRKADQDRGDWTVNVSSDRYQQLPIFFNVNRFHLAFVEGPEKGKEWSSKGKRCSIGSHRSNDLLCSDRTISRFHCEIDVGPTGAFLTDLESRNGSFVDGVRVKQAWLREGSVLILGQTILTFHVSDEVNPLRLSPKTHVGSMVGVSVLMRAVFAEMEAAAAASDSTVLLEGETGTGKELVARSIHELSSRAKKPFVVVDCGSIPANLLESELFGHERGAFTSAVSRRDGAFIVAAGGTIFLDEIGELPLELQPKLLRVIEEKTVRRIGDSKVRHLDVRVIAATNRNLRTQVNEGVFRSDLYYRLAVISITLPPLRARPDDIPLLVDFMLKDLNADSKVIAELKNETVMSRLRNAAWVGNVRELRNYLERCMVYHEAQPIGDSSPAHTMSARQPADFADGRLEYAKARQVALEDFERRYVQSLLQRHSGNVSKAARAAGINRAYLYRLMERHQLKR